MYRLVEHVKELLADGCRNCCADASGAGAFVKDEHPMSACQRRAYGVEVERFETAHLHQIYVDPSAADFSKDILSLLDAVQVR
eukprot:scaffold100695_cov32-Tisochrysis_lutea.AAC.3